MKCERTETHADFKMKQPPTRMRMRNIALNVRNCFKKLVRDPFYSCFPNDESKLTKAMVKVGPGSPLSWKTSSYLYISGLRQL